MAEEPIHLIGNAHLDPAWMWQMSEGFEAFVATCRSALARIQEFPDFIFTCSSAAHYEFVEQTDSRLFKEIQQAVSAGRWSIVGGWWVEADCNLPSGESFVRQALLAQRYFQSRFGKIATVGYNVDSFGHNANLPQLLSKAGMTSYLFMRPQQDEKPLKEALFNWEAPNGDRVLTYRLPLHYSNHQHSVREKIRRLNSYDLFNPHQPWMIFYGVGNHGGGPTIEQIREALTVRGEGKNVQFSEPSTFFADIDGQSLPVIRDEMQPHAIGCYSAHSEIKRLNRHSENILVVAESISALAEFAGVDVGKLNIEQAWKNVCFNQFHDILGGVAIKEACDDAITLYRESIASAERVTRIAVQSIASRINTANAIESLIVFNPSAFEREEIVKFELWNPEASERGKMLTSVVLIDSEGKTIPTQKVEPSGKIGEDRVRFIAKVHTPALGWSRYRIERHQTIEQENRLIVTSERINNAMVTVGLDPKAAQARRDPHAGLGYTYVSPIYLDDNSDTWSHGLHSFEGESHELSNRINEVKEAGPIRATVRVSSEEYDAALWEDVSIVEGTDYIDMSAKLDWRRKHSILKFRFPHGCARPVARYEIAYASIERPIGPNEWPGQTWVDVSESDESRGLAIISDSKYSYSVDDKYIYVIVARSALYAHHVPPHDIEVDALPGDYLDHGWQEFKFRIVPHKGNWQKANLPRRSEVFLRPLIAHIESGHEGDLPASFSGLKYSSPGIMIGALKIAEDSKAVILRAAEQGGTPTDCTFMLGGKAWSSNFYPFEIKTFQISGDTVLEVDLLERPQ